MNFLKGLSKTAGAGKFSMRFHNKMLNAARKAEKAEKRVFDMSMKMPDSLDGLTPKYTNKLNRAVKSFEKRKAEAKKYKRYRDTAYAAERAALPVATGAAGLGVGYLIGKKHGLPERD